MKQVIYTPENPPTKGVAKKIWSAPRCDEDNIGRVNKIDEKFIEEYAEGFPELRTIGTKGLCEKYVGRYHINIYGHVPFWAQDMIVDLTKAQKIIVKEKKDRNDW